MKSECYDITRASSAKSSISQEVLEHAERTFLTPKAMQEGEKSNVPSLDEFDSEIDTYRVSRGSCVDNSDKTVSDRKATTGQSECVSCCKDIV